MKSWIAGGILLAFGAVIPARSQTVTSDVFRVKALVQGVIEFGESSNQAVHPVQLTGPDLVNLALGRVLGTKLQTNEVLAFGSSLTTNSTRLFVFDSNTASNLVTIGQIDPEVQAIGLAKHRNTSEAIAEMTVPAAGNSTNGLAGGNLTLDGVSILETNGTLTKFSAKSIGVLGTIVQSTNYDFTCTTNVISSTRTNIVCVTNSFTVFGSNYTVLVRGATITTQGKKIGTLIEGH